MSTGLLALFGCKMLYEGWHMSPEEGQEEFEEVSQELRKREEVVGVVSTSDRKLVVFCSHNKRIGIMCYTVKSHPLWCVIGIYMTYKCVL